MKVRASAFRALVAVATATTLVSCGDKPDSTTPPAATVSQFPAPLVPESLAVRAKRLVVVLECLSDGEQTGMGSGFIVDTAGFIATNAHVVLMGDEVRVRRDEAGPPMTADVLLLDVDRDIAILRCSPTSGLAFLMADSLPAVGQRVYAVGHPGGLEFSVSDGIVSGIRELPNGLQLIQTTAPISRGSSGGPLLDVWGRVVGMTRMNLADGQNLNFAVSAADIRFALQEAIEQATSSASQGATAPRLSSRTSPRTLALTARALRRTGQLERARALLSDGERCCPNDSLILLELAELALEEDRLVDAEFYANQLLALFPEHFSGHYLRARMLLETEAFALARAEGELALRLGPGDDYVGQVHAVLASIGLALEDDPSAVLAHFDQAMRGVDTSQNKDARALRTCLLARAGRAAEARAEAGGLVTQWPDDSALRDQLRDCGANRGVVILSSNGAWNEAGTLVVRGVVRNEDVQRRVGVRVIVECFDSTNTIVESGVSYVTPGYSFDPGMTGTFAVLIKGDPSRVSRWEARVVDP